MNSSIVIVDHDPLFLELMGFCLTTYGYNTVRCDHREQAYPLIDAIRPELVIVDIGPSTYEDALQLINLLRRDASLSRSAVVACSIDREFLKTRATELACMGVETLSKPFHLTDLLLSIERQIGPGRSYQLAA